MLFQSQVLLYVWEKVSDPLAGGVGHVQLGELILVAYFITIATGALNVIFKHSKDDTWK